VTTYESRIEAQIEQYRGGVNAHELPKIFHYWARPYLFPRIKKVFGIETMDEFFAAPLESVANRSPGAEISVLSIGSGDCSADIGVARALQKRGVRFKITATELSPILVKQANQAIADAGLKDHMKCVQADLNSWTCKSASFDAAIASQSLHHIQNLEHVFGNLKVALKPGAVFAVSDMIGRNGHMRWPETLEVLEKFWAMLPDRYKANRLLKRVELEYINHDCSTEGFEGIRAQDILPLVLAQFHPGKFLAVGGLIDVFIDRCFGHNFNEELAFDRAFIDLVQHVNDVMLNQHIITPTMLLAYFHVDPAELVCWEQVTPDTSVRWPYKSIQLHKDVPQG
jgi:SAM-dependent methyltransferase